MRKKIRKYRTRRMDIIEIFSASVKRSQELGQSQCQIKIYLKIKKKNSIEQIQRISNIRKP